MQESLRREDVLAMAGDQEMAGDQKMAGDGQPWFGAGAGRGRARIVG